LTDFVSNRLLCYICVSFYMQRYTIVTANALSSLLSFFLLFDFPTAEM